VREISIVSFGRVLHLVTHERNFYHKVEIKDIPLILFFRSPCF